MRRLLVGLFFFVGLAFLFSNQAWAQTPCNPGSTSTCPNSGSDLCKPTTSGFFCADSSGRIYGVDAGAGSKPLEEWEVGVCVDTNGVATLQGFGCIFKRILGIIVPLLGLALFVLLLAGGFQYMTAGGDPKQTQKASGTITTAIVGIVVVIGVWFIFQILKALTGIDLLQFVIPG